MTVEDRRGDKGGEISGCLQDFVKHGRVKLEYIEYIYTLSLFIFFSLKLYSFGSRGSCIRN